MRSGLMATFLYLTFWKKCDVAVLPRGCNKINFANKEKVRIFAFDLEINHEALCSFLLMGM